jgi:hypothetical protein
MTRLSIPFVISKGIRLVSLESTAELNLQFLPVRCSLPKNTCGFDHTFVQNVWQVRKMTFVPIFVQMGVLAENDNSYPAVAVPEGCIKRASALNLAATLITNGHD